MKNHIMNNKPEKSVEQIVELLCRKDNHVSGDSGDSNKYAIKKSSLRKALQAERQRCEEMVEEVGFTKYTEGYKQGKFDKEMDYAGYTQPPTQLTNDPDLDENGADAFERQGYVPPTPHTNDKE